MRRRIWVFMARECPVCGHALRMAIVSGRLVWVCPVCGPVTGRG